MISLRKGKKTPPSTIKGGCLCAWLLFMLLSSPFTLPAFAEQLPTSERASSIKPNVITIITDDQGWADIGYNNPKVYTPHLDALAAESALCTRHHSMPQCTPTRIAAFTGRYPGRFGEAGVAASNAPVFPHGTLNLATFLKANGYKTYLAGKWHMGVSKEHGPHHHGFDSSYGSYAGAVGAYDHRYRTNLPKLAITWHRDGKIIQGHENGKHVTDLVTDEAIRIIKKHAPPTDDGATVKQAGGGQAPNTQPFFLYLAYHAPHTPLDERGEFVNTPTQLDPDKPGRWLNEDKIKWFHDPKGIIQTEKDPEKRLYLAVLHHLDDGIGQVLQALDDTGQRENTLILFTSDNGPQINWPGNAYPDDLKLTDFNPVSPLRGSKCHVYEGGNRVPGLVHWRGKIPARQIHHPIHVVDWLPTIAGFIAENPKPADDGAKTSSLGGVQALIPEGQAELDGHDNSALFLTKAAPPTRVIYQLWGRPGNRWALSLGNWKVVYYGKKEPRQADWQLYDLNQDPKESKNLAKKHPDKVKQLHELFLKERAKDRKTKSNL